MKIDQNKRNNFSFYESILFKAILDERHSWHQEVKRLTSPHSLNTGSINSFKSKELIQLRENKMF